MAKAKKPKTRAQVEAMQRKAVRFLNDVADKPDLADDIEDMSVEEYARHKHITIANPRQEAARAWKLVGKNPDTVKIKGRTYAILERLSPADQEAQGRPNLAHEMRKHGIAEDLVLGGKRGAMKRAYRYKSGAVKVYYGNPHGKCKQYADKCVPRSQMAWAPGSDVSKWKLRIDNATHVRDAMARFNQTTGIPRDKRKLVARRLVKAGNKFGIDSANFRRRYLGGGKKRATQRRRNAKPGLRRVATLSPAIFKTAARARKAVADLHAVPLSRVGSAKMKHKGRLSYWEVPFKSNPDVPLREAQALYKEFHGAAPKRVLQMQMSEARRGTYTALGELAELHFKAPNKEKIQLGFEGGHVKLASSPDGNQLYLIGGDQKMPENLLRQFGVEGEKDFEDLGEATDIVYVTRKGFDGFRESAYIHKFGEEGGYRPHGFYNRLQKAIILAGGSYHIEAPGIIN